MNYNKEDLIALFKQNYLDRLPEWYCKLNCFKIPDDFPISLTLYENDKDAFLDPLWRLAFDVVSEILGDKSTSKAWWTIQLERTEEEWQTWWDNKLMILGE